MAKRLESNKEEPLTEVWSENWKLMMPKGGQKIVHARGCEYVKNWDMSGCIEVHSYNPKKQVVCRTCAKLVYTTLGAEDFIENKDKYNEFYALASDGAIYRLYVEAKAKTHIYGNKLYIKCRQDNWYLDFTDGISQMKIYHNNYNVKERAKGEDWAAIGYHEHELVSDVPSGRLNEALNAIYNYDYKKSHEAKETNSSKKSKASMTFSEYDEQYSGAK